MKTITGSISLFFIVILLMSFEIGANGFSSNSFKHDFSPDGTNGIKFTKGQQTLGNMRSFGVAIGDVDMDGDNDVFTTNYIGPCKLWLNDGNGYFVQSGQNFGNWESHGVAIRDLNGDGYPDIFLLNHAAPSKVYFNNGSGIFAASSQNIGSPTDYPGMIVLGDVDNDGDLDAFLSYYLLPNRLWMNDGTGHFTITSTEFGGQDGHSMELADVNSDGFLDLFISLTEHADEIWMNDGHGNFTNSGQHLGDSTGVESVDGGDIDGDEDIDFVISNNTAGLKIWLNQNNTGSFLEAGPYFGSSSVRCKLFDADLDGDLDLITAHSGDGNLLWVNDGNGNYDSAGPVFGNKNVIGIECADLDGDGDYDVVLGQLEGTGGNSIYFNETILHPTYEGQIAYCYQPMQGGLHQIYRINSDGSNNTKMINAQIGLNHHDWSPDAKMLAAVGYVNQTTSSIYKFNSDGTGLTRLTTTANVFDSEPSWSPDGSKIAFTRIYRTQNYRNELWLMNADGSNQHYIGVVGFAAKWSPDGTKFIFTNTGDWGPPGFKGSDIKICDTNGTNVQQITHTTGDEWYPSWSPDGNSILFGYSSEGNYASNEIFKMNSDTTARQQLTTNNCYDCSPRWSPDGSRICYASDNSAYQHWEIYVMNNDGSNIIRVTNTPSNATAINPVWKPNTDPTPVKDNGQSFNSVPQKFQLFQNYPNPFNPGTSIQYAINSSHFVTLKVYDVVGKEIETLVNEEKTAGKYAAHFTTTDLTSGIYFYRLQLDNGSYQTNKMCLIK